MSDFQQQRLAPVDDEESLTPPPPKTFRILCETTDFLLAENGDILRKEQNT